MPIFDFTCRQCSHVFEKLCLPNRETNVMCPQCQSDDITKNVSAASIKLVGSGWYADGYGLNPPRAKSTVET